MPPRMYDLHAEFLPEQTIERHIVVQVFGQTRKARQLKVGLVDAERSFAGADKAAHLQHLCAARDAKGLCRRRICRHGVDGQKLVVRIGPKGGVGFRKAVELYQAGHDPLDGNECALAGAFFQHPLVLQFADGPAHRDPADGINFAQLGLGRQKAALGIFALTDLGQKALLELAVKRNGIEAREVVGGICQPALPGEIGHMEKAFHRRLSGLKNALKIFASLTIKINPIEK